MFGVSTHQSHDVPGVTPTEGLAAAEGDGDHDEDDEGAEVGRQVGLHRFFDHVGEGEHAHHAEGEQQLDGQDAEHLFGEIHHWILGALRRVLTPGWEIHVSQALRPTDLSDKPSPHCPVIKWRWGYEWGRVRRGLWYDVPEGLVPTSGLIGARCLSFGWRICTWGCGVGWRLLPLVGVCRWWWGHIIRRSMLCLFGREVVGCVWHSGGNWGVKTKFSQTQRTNAGQMEYILLSSKREGPVSCDLMYCMINQFNFGVWATQRDVSMSAHVVDTVYRGTYSKRRPVCACSCPVCLWRRCTCAPQHVQGFLHQIWISKCNQTYCWLVATERSKDTEVKLEPWGHFSFTQQTWWGSRCCAIASGLKKTW